MADLKVTLTLSDLVAGEISLLLLWRPLSQMDQ